MRMREGIEGLGKSWEGGEAGMSAGCVWRAFGVTAKAELRCESGVSAVLVRSEDLIRGGHGPTFTS